MYVEFQRDSKFYPGVDAKVETSVGKTLVLVNPTWDDQQVNLGAVGVGSSAPTWTAYKSSKVLAFSKSQDNEITFTLQYSHRIKTGTSTEMHVHTIAPDNNAGDVVWQLTVSYASINGTFGDAETFTKTQSIAADSANVHKVFEIVAEMLENVGISGVAFCSLKRLGTDVADTYDNDIYLAALDSHFQIDTMGSRQEYIK